MNPKSKHTPGPWNCFQRNYKGLVGGIVRDKNNEAICNCSLQSPIDRKKTREEIDANARLIAAAPELLEACEKSMEWLRSTHSWISLNNGTAGEDMDRDMKFIETAISKAEGRG